MRDLTEGTVCLKDEDKGMHTTNYYNTFIEVAEDCPAKAAMVPPTTRDAPTIADAHFQQLSQSPYRYTSDDVVFGAHVLRKQIPEARLEEERERFFAKGQACLRCSPLAKRYGWGFHFDGEGKVAIYPVESSEYRRFLKDGSLRHLRAMRSSKKT